jgi:hypothetical protein
MRRNFSLFMFILYLGALTYSGIGPQHTFAAPHIIYRQVVVTAPEKKEYDQSNHEAHSRMMNKRFGKTFAPPESQAEKSSQSSLGIPWPSISFPDLSFLWKPQPGSQKKDIYNRGQ